MMKKRKMKLRNMILHSCYIFIIVSPSLIFAMDQCKKVFAESNILIAKPIPPVGAPLDLLESDLNKILNSVCGCSQTCNEESGKIVGKIQCQTLKEKIKQCERQRTSHQTSVDSLNFPKKGIMDTSQAVPDYWDYYVGMLNSLAKRPKLFSTVKPSIALMFCDSKTISIKIQDARSSDTLRSYFQAISLALENSISSGILKGKQIDSTLGELLPMLGNKDLSFARDSITVSIANLVFERIHKNRQLYPALVRVLRENEGSFLLDIIQNQDKIDWVLRQRAQDAHEKMRNIVDSLARVYDRKNVVSDSALNRISEKAMQLLQQGKGRGMMAVLPFPRGGNNRLPANSDVIKSVREHLMKRLGNEYSTVDVGDYSDLEELQHYIQKNVGDSVSRAMLNRFKNRNKTSQENKFIVLCPFNVDVSNNQLHLHLRVADFKDAGIIAVVNKNLTLSANDHEIISGVDSMIGDLKSELMNSALWSRYQRMMIDSTKDFPFASGSENDVSLYSNRTLKINSSNLDKLKTIQKVKAISVSAVFGTSDSRAERYSEFKNTLLEALRKNFGSKFVVEDLARSDSTLSITASVADTVRNMLALNFMVLKDTLLSISLPATDDDKSSDIAAYFAADIVCGILSNYLERNLETVKRNTCPEAGPCPESHPKISPWAFIPAFFPAGSSQIIHSSFLTPKGKSPVPRILYGSFLTATQLTFMGLALGYDQAAVTAEKNGDIRRANVQLDRKYGFFWASVATGVIGSVSFLVDRLINGK
jgi:hypothetical protein